MARPRLCPHCRQPLAEERFGIRLPTLKAALVDTIVASGDAGISSTEILGGQLYADRAQVDESTIKSHVFQINEMLELTPYRITSDRRRWFFVKHRRGRR